MAAPVVHFEILGPDGAALEEFYATLFGWTFQSMEGADGYGLTQAGGESGIGGGVGGSDDGGPLVTVYAGVDDAQEALDRAVALGASVVTPLTAIPGVVTFARFRDPQGNVVGVVSDPPPPAA